MCILTLDAIQHIVEEQATQNITFQLIYNLTFLFDMWVDITSKRKKDYYIIGHVE
jgi:hypothetical protein